MWFVRSQTQHYTGIPKSERRGSISSQLDDSSSIDSSTLTLTRRARICEGRLALTIFATVLLLFGAIASLRPNISSARGSSSQEFHCGNSTASARALNCSFDLLSYSWVPSPCYDAGTAGEFREWAQSSERQNGSWPFFEDREGKKWIATEAELAERVGLKTRTTQEEHLGHCTFMMRRMQRILDGKAEKVKGMDENHVVHCSNEILKGLKGPDPVDAGRLASVFTIGFGTC